MARMTYKYAYNIMNLKPTDATFKDVKRLYEKSINNGDKKLLRATDFILNKSPEDNHIPETALIHQYYNHYNIDQPSKWNDLYNQYHVYFEKLDYKLNQKIYAGIGIVGLSAFIGFSNLLSENKNGFVISLSGLSMILAWKLIISKAYEQKERGALSVFNKYKKISKQQTLQKNMKIKKVH